MKNYPAGPAAGTARAGAGGGAVGGGGGGSSLTDCQTAAGRALIALLFVFISFRGPVVV